MQWNNLKEMLRHYDADCKYAGIPPGWINIVDILIQDLIAMGWDRELRQIKSKFGVLCFYIDSKDKAIVARIGEACFASSKTCEECGSEAKLENTNGWYRTVCADCLATKAWEIRRKNAI